ncbi:phage head spike fiber domain-containing protein [Massilia aerilata]|uniref:Uncharacterized protein n=1 Tax=Massilia aerilata TaxID=453817 RepID=A0ABW0S5I1_9BURK
MNAEKTLSNIEPIALSEATPITRASPKYVYDRTGTLVQVPVDTLAVTYDPSDLTKAPYALVEPAATNLLKYSERFATLWSTDPNAGSATENFALAPDGQMSANLIAAQLNGASTVCGYRYQSQVLTAGDWTLSVFVGKLAASPYVLLQLATGFRVCINLDTREYFAVALPAGTITCEFLEEAAGLVRIAISGTLPAGNAVTMIGLGSSTGQLILAPAYAVGEGHLFWGAQLEQGRKATSYIPTAAAAVTRAADSIAPDYGLIFSTLSENDDDDAPLYIATKTYAAGDRVRRAETHQVYESAVANNLGNTPEQNSDGSAAKWTRVRPTNRWAMFDGSIGTSSEADETLTVVLRPGVAIDSIYGVVDADLAQVCVHDAPGGNIIYQNTIELEASAPSDWDEYFWDPFKPLPDFLITGLDPYYECFVTVTLSKASGKVGCAGLVLGTQWQLGATQYGVKVKPKSYSYVGEDEYGNTTIRSRKKSTDLAGTAWLDRSEASYVNQIGQRLLDVPAVWIASSNPEDFALRCYGLGSLEISYDFPQDCQLSFNVKGVISATNTTA